MEDEEEKAAAKTSQEHNYARREQQGPRVASQVEGHSLQRKSRGGDKGR